MNTEYWNHLEGKIGEEIKQEINNLIESKNYYPYIKDSIQNDAPKWGQIIYNGYADLGTEFLYMTLTNKDQTFYGKIKSPLKWPAMIDRIWCMDRMDAQAYNWLSDIMCSVYLEGKTQEEVFETWDKNFAAEKAKNS